MTRENLLLFLLEVKAALDALAAIEGRRRIAVLSCLEFTGSPLIASVTRQFPQDGRRGGHLVVVTDVDNGPVARICCRDPASGGIHESRIPAARFFASFAGRIIVFPRLA